VAIVLGEFSRELLGIEGVHAERFIGRAAGADTAVEGLPDDITAPGGVEIVNMLAVEV
jgi:hypothetical protein